MIIRSTLLLFTLLFSGHSFAFPCFFTIVKQTCWLNYNVDVTIIDVKSRKPITTVTIPKGQLWARQEFTCDTNQKIVYSATFNPTIWETGAGDVYYAQRFWELPGAIIATQKAWELRVCFPRDFSEVPIPATGGDNCKCDFSGVTPIPPQS